MRPSATLVAARAFGPAHAAAQTRLRVHQRSGPPRSSAEVPDESKAFHRGGTGGFRSIEGEARRPADRP